VRFPHPNDTLAHPRDYRTALSSQHLRSLRPPFRYVLRPRSICPPTASPAAPLAPAPSSTHSQRRSRQTHLLATNPCTPRPLALRGLPRRTFDPSAARAHSGSRARVRSGSDGPRRRRRSRSTLGAATRARWAIFRASSFEILFWARPYLDLRSSVRACVGSSILPPSCADGPILSALYAAFPDQARPSLRSPPDIAPSNERAQNQPRSRVARVSTNPLLSWSAWQSLGHRPSSR
ncbi:uncharacterized protein C8Q71DRAFT_911246, partial [Rhodofomes roseus]